MFILCRGSRISQASDHSFRAVDSEVMKVCGMLTIGVLLGVAGTAWEGADIWARLPLFSLISVRVIPKRMGKAAEEEIPLVVA